MKYIISGYWKINYPFFYGVNQFVLQKQWTISRITENYLEHFTPLLPINNITNSSKHVIQKKQRSPKITRLNGDTVTLWGAHNQCVIWPWGDYSEDEVSVWFHKFIFLFLCLALAASEGRVNGGEDFFQKVSVESTFGLCFASSSACVQTDLRSAFF